MVPPKVVRRLVVAPLVIVLALTLLLLSPFLSLLALLLPSRYGRRRTMRLIWFAVVWALMEAMALLACLGMWVSSGFGGRIRSRVYQERHYALMGWFLGRIFRIATRVFDLRVEIDEPERTPEELRARLARPVIVLSRHAGPGDSFLLVHHLLNRYQRRPRIVMKAALQLDPSIDVVINRLPHAFVRPRSVVLPGGSGGVTADTAVSEESTASEEPGSRESPVIGEIRRLAAGLANDGALVIFPEGGNFTRTRWRLGIQRLEQRRRYADAWRARRMTNLLPPRSGGVTAALQAAPAADVIFVAHTGLDDLVTVADVWRGLPMETVIKARWWRVVATDVPRTHEALVPWLFDWWERIDAWIAHQRVLRGGDLPREAEPARDTGSAGEIEPAGDIEPAGEIEPAQDAEPA
ncbi:1-acyl-sn-glycerol-3-phosphate acyltransferase [Luedemannella helvata]|uniref:Phospholipid/glycerol acyltransferase domain-containing protein n=1 Tax=Luedemannella helvata TaxID=349315 RepID=A0ABP4W3D5_9ACTN